MAKLKMVGTCPECGAIIVSRYPFMLGECFCKGNPAIEVPLEPALILAPRHLKQIEKVSKNSGIPVPQLTDALLTEASKAVMRGMKIKK
jgi:hypothetical protein